MTNYMQSFILDPPTIIRYISSRISSEASASELLENLEDMFPRYYICIVVMLSACSTLQPHTGMWPVAIDDVVHKCVN